MISNPRISQNIQMVSRALRVVARFSASARQTTSHQEVLNKMTEALAKAHYADRVSFYHLDPFGHLHIHTSYPADAVAESHVRNIAPEGPLKTVIDEQSFVYVPNLLRPDFYYQLDSTGTFKRIDGNHLNPRVTRDYVDKYGETFKRTGETMDMLFGCLSVQDKIFGAFKADAFPSGRALKLGGMEIEDLLSLSVIVGNAASQSLDELASRAAIVKEKKEAERLFARASDLLRGFKHAIGGRLGIPMGYIDLTKSIGDLSPKQTEYLIKSLSLMKGLDAYLEEYLAPIKEGSLEIKIEKSPASIREILSPLEGLNISVHIAEDVPEYFSTDRKKIEDIIFGLIENARKFSPEKPVITVLAKVAGGEIEISVKDQGKGMTREQIDRIFEGGVRFHPDIKGSGWGLYGYREILNKLGGMITAESDGPDKGSTFVIRLPID